MSHGPATARPTSHELAWLASTLASGSVLHCRQHWRGDLEFAGIDIFRFHDNGKIVGHWDVLQVLPDPVQAKNDNGVFWRPTTSSDIGARSQTSGSRTLAMDLWEEGDGAPERRVVAQSLGSL